MCLQLIFSNKQSDIFQKLEDITETSFKLGLDYSKELHEAHDQITRIFDHHKYQREEMNSSFQAIAKNQDEMKLILDKLERLSQQAAVTETSTEVLRSLQFSGMHDRHSSIHERHQHTFSWIYEDNTSPFKSWLEEGNGAFWISGKAGSGKSTLMKFIDNSSRTTELLQSWAGQRQLIMASFYFWNTGTDIETEMQKSQEGLLRSILYKILLHEPDLIPSVLPSRWQEDTRFHQNPSPWRLEELNKALDVLIQVKPKAYFCLLIDGLDEYAGDADQQDGFAKRIMNLSESPNVKICVASRPWVPFKNVFGQNESRMVTLESLTRDDMDTYVRDLLQKDTRFAALLKREPSAIDLVHEIRNKARGVFLWVVLVVRSLRSGLTQNDNLKELRRRLDNLPASLKKFFRRMLDTIDEEYRLYACRVLYMARCAAPLPLRTFYWVQIEEENEDYAIQAANEQRDGSNDHKETAKSLLNKWTKDLLEVYHSGDDYSANASIADYQIGFIHRTVGEFLADPDIQQMLESTSGQDFDPNRSICRVLLAEAKHTRCELKRGSTDELLQIACRSMYHAKRFEMQHQYGLTALLRGLDDVISSRLHGRFAAHWTASFDITHPSEVSNHRKTVSNASSNFLAYAVANNLVEVVRETLDAAPYEVQKRGRPLLDFAIYPTFPKHQRHQFSADIDYRVDMVGLLLKRGASVNQHAGVKGIMTTWQMFLLDVSAIHKSDRSFDKSRAWEIAQLFLTHGANRDAEVPVKKVVEDINISDAFGVSTDRQWQRVYVRRAGVAECLAVHVEQPERVANFLARLPDNKGRLWMAWTPWNWWSR